MWSSGAAILVLSGYDLLAHDQLGWTAYLVIGIGLGVGSGVVGSLIHDALAGSRERL